jgi:hypothetical protein
MAEAAEVPGGVHIFFLENSATQSTLLSMVKMSEPSENITHPATISEQVLDDVRFLRQAVERNVRVTTLSPAGLLLTGVSGLAATAATTFLPAFADQLVTFSEIYAFYLPWGCALVLSLGANVVGMRARLRKQGGHNRPVAFRLMLFSLSAPLLLGGIFSLWILFNAPQPWIAAAGWTVFYGLGLVAASGHTIEGVRILGVSSLAASVALLFFGSASPLVVAMALGLVFGLGHVLLALHVGETYGW